MTEKKTYLGDGAYYDLTRGGVVLSTSRGGEDDLVYLGPHEVERLLIALVRDFGKQALLRVMDNAPEDADSAT